MGCVRIQQGTAFLRYEDEHDGAREDRVFHRSAYDQWEGHVRVSASTPAVAAVMVGILVHGGNHFIVRGPEPSRPDALRLAHYWSIIQIGGDTPPGLEGWRISTREVRADLEGAVVVAGDGEMTPAGTKLFAQIAARGISNRDFRAKFLAPT